MVVRETTDRRVVAKASVDSPEYNIRTFAGDNRTPRIGFGHLDAL
jgi:hypothetical protein